MNTTIIDKILIHMLDMEHSQIIYSDQFIDLIEGTTEYYDKKIEKCLTNTTIKELVVGSEHHLLQAARNIINLLLNLKRLLKIYLLSANMLKKCLIVI